MPIPPAALESLYGSENGDAESVVLKRGDEIFAGTDYPREWAGFVGQAEAKEQLIVGAASAKARGVRLEHTLLASPIAGVGKTTLAHLAAYEAGVGIVQATGPITVEKARSTMLQMQDQDILFVDEAHTLVAGNKNKADWLLPFMTEGQLYGPRGAEKMPDVTLFAATTDVGKLPTTLIGRFMCSPDIVHYTPAEGAEIAFRNATRMGIEIAPEYCVPITMAADHNPRVMRKILTQIRNLGHAYPDTYPNLDKAFKWAGVSTDGLQVTAREILVLLLAARDYTSSLDSIRAHLGESGPIHHHEQVLLQRGFITITGRGRQLTDPGRQRARQEVTALRSAS